MSSLVLDEKNYIRDITLSETPSGGWVLFYIGELRGRVFEMAIFLRSMDQEDAMEEVYECLYADDDPERRHEILAITTILPNGGDDEQESDFEIVDDSVPDSNSVVSVGNMGEVESESKSELSGELPESIS